MRMLKWMEEIQEEKNEERSETDERGVRGGWSRCRPRRGPLSSRVHTSPHAYIRCDPQPQPLAHLQPHSYPHPQQQPHPQLRAHLHPRQRALYWCGGLVGGCVERSKRGRMQVGCRLADVQHRSTYRATCAPRAHAPGWPLVDCTTCEGALRRCTPSWQSAAPSVE